MAFMSSSSDFVFSFGASLTNFDECESSLFGRSLPQVDGNEPSFRPWAEPLPSLSSFDTFSSTNYSSKFNTLVTPTIDLTSSASSSPSLSPLFSFSPTPSLSSESSRSTVTPSPASTHSSLPDVHWKHPGIPFVWPSHLAPLVHEEGTLKAGMEHRADACDPPAAPVAPQVQQRPLDFRPDVPTDYWVTIESRQRSDRDLYSPLFVRKWVSGKQEGLCTLCEDIDAVPQQKRWQEWYSLMSPSYADHMTIWHGVSPYSKLPYMPPGKLRMNEHVKKNHDTLCGICAKWIHNGVIGRCDRVDGTGGDWNDFTLWFLHARACHPDSRVIAAITRDILDGKVPGVDYGSPRPSPPPEPVARRIAPMPSRVRQKQADADADYVPPGTSHGNRKQQGSK